MIVYKCKMCDANLPVESEKKIIKCEYCDTFQSVPSCDDEKKAVLFNRANHFRQNGEFDKAYSIYEHILEEDATDPEVYWSIVLCKYGIEYVEDPSTKQRKATVNRTQKHSILQDADYLSALERADDELKKFYASEAEYVDKIQRKILAIANEEKAYDVFISYKEKTVDGSRTKSSVIAQDLWDRLTKAGYRTFFSRISLEDKIGSEFEPYIYSALQSARVMIVLGTQKEEFVAPWVKNEWSRFLLAMKEDSGKKLIPCYLDVDVYDLPDEFQILQGQDISKIGYEQDLIRGIGKILENKSKNENASLSTSDEKMFKNGETLLFLRNFNEAVATYTELCRRVPEDYRSWWGRIRAVSKEFTDIDVLKSDYADFKMWMECVKKLADGETYSEILDNFAGYLDKASTLFANEDKRRIVDALTRYKENTKKIEDELSDEKKDGNNTLLELKRVYEKADDLVRGLEYDVNVYKDGIESGFKIVIICLILNILGFTLFTLTFSLNIQILLVPAFFIFVICIPYMIDNFKRMTNSETLLPEAKKQLEAAYKSKKNAEDNVRNREAYNKRRYKPLDDKIVERNRNLELINKYINNDPEANRKLTLAMMCKEFGIEKEYDKNLYDMRENIYALLNE